MADGCGASVPAPFVVYSPPDSHYYLHAHGYTWARHKRPEVICAAMREARAQGAGWLARVFESREETAFELVLAAEEAAARRLARAANAATEATHRDRLAATTDLSELSLDDLL